MEITNTGYNCRHPIGFTIDRPHGSGDYILLIIRSDALFILDGKRMHVPASSAFIYKKGTPQLFGSCDKEYVNDWIHFDLLEGEEKDFSELGIPFDTVIPLADTVELSNYIKCIFMERHSQSMHREQSMMLYFKLLLLKLSEKAHPPVPKKESHMYHVLSTLRNEIQLSPQSKWSIDAITRKTQMSRSYVQHLYKRFFGISITEDIQCRRIEYAKYLLSSTGEKISSVAKCCGYESDVHFMRIFKKETSMTPSEFRSSTQFAP